MKSKVLAIVFLMILSFGLPLFAEDEVVFESVLKDAIFSPYWTGGSGVAKEGCWTLKFV